VSRQRPENNGVGSKFSKKKKERGITFFLSQFSSASNWATRQTWADTVETRPRQACIERSNGPMRSTAYSVPTVLSSISSSNSDGGSKHANKGGKTRDPNPNPNPHREPPPTATLLLAPPPSSRQLSRTADPMDCDAASAAGDDPMDFSWTAGWEASAASCASPDPTPAPAPAPATSPQEEAESMILASGPRVAVAGLRRGDCLAGGSSFFSVLSWFLDCSCAHFQGASLVTFHVSLALPYAVDLSRDP
jgi:hypothetical protein